MGKYCLTYLCPAQVFSIHALFLVDTQLSRAQSLDSLTCHLYVASLDYNVPLSLRPEIQIL